VAWVGYHGLTNVIPGGGFNPDEPATRELVAEMLHRMAVLLRVSLPVVQEAAVFTDQIAISYQNAVRAMQQAGIINGFPDGSFGPSRTITRAEMAVMMDGFTDLPGLTPVR
jgi:hypothetical protein